MKTALQKLTLSLAFVFGLALAANAQVGITVETTQNGNEVTAEFRAYNFTDIVSMQFSMNWNPAQMEFSSTSDYELPGMSNANFGTVIAANGALSVSWFDQAVEGVSVPNCHSIFTVKFNLLGGQIPQIIITDSPTTIELIDNNGIELSLTQNLGCDDIGQFHGNIFHDSDPNCLPDAGELGLENWMVEIEGNGFTFYRTANENGDFVAFLSAGNYDASLVLPPNGLWGTCSPSQNFDIVVDETTTGEFPAQVLFECPSLNVDLSAAFLRRCFDSYYHIEYCNDGTATAEDAYVEIEFDDFLEVQSSSIPWTTVDGNTYTFPIGDVPLGECGSFSVTVYVSCDAELGQTHCSTANIYPQDPCVPPSALWDGSSLTIDGTCDGDSVRFTVTNVGDDMTQAAEYFIVVDDMIMFDDGGDPIQLLAQEVWGKAFPATGATYRLEVEQAEDHPGLSMPSLAIEGCDDGSSTASFGFVNMYPLDDADPWIDIDCQPNIGAYDPNDKIGFPSGYGPEHYIEPGTEIEYRIRFQNTGTDTAFNVTLLDTLSPLLDPTSVRPGASSHPYNFKVTGEGVLNFAFPWILLPDSSANEPASNGFVKFTVSPRIDIPLGSVIENSAAIYFDFNPAVITNTYHHTVDEDFIMQEPNAVGFTPFTDTEVSISPNPIADGRRPALMIETENPKELDIQIFSLNGKALYAGNGTAQSGTTLLTLQVGLQSGTYLVKVTDRQGQGQALKLLVN